MSGLRVLMVDDEEFPRLHLAGLLRGLGIEAIREAAGGLEARDILAAAGGDFDLVISDIDMPDLDGHALARWLRDEAPVAVPLALISGRVSGGEAIDGALAVLAKPATTATLSSLLARARRAGRRAG